MTDDPTSTAADLLHGYCAAVDGHDAATLSSLFSESAQLTVDGRHWTGRDAIVSFLAGLFDQRRWSRHLVTNLRVELDGGDNPIVRAYYVGILGNDDGLRIGLGDYRMEVLVSKRSGLQIAALDVNAVVRLETPAAQWTDPRPSNLDSPAPPT